MDRFRELLASLPLFTDEDLARAGDILCEQDLHPSHYPPLIDLVEGLPAGRRMLLIGKVIKLSWAAGKYESVELLKVLPQRERADLSAALRRIAHGITEHRQRATSIAPVERYRTWMSLAASVEGPENIVLYRKALDAATAIPDFASRFETVLRGLRDVPAEVRPTWVNAAKRHASRGQYTGAVRELLLRHGLETAKGNLDKPLLEIAKALPKSQARKSTVGRLQRIFQRRDARAFSRLQWMIGGLAGYAGGSAVPEYPDYLRVFDDGGAAAISQPLPSAPGGTPESATPVVNTGFAQRDQVGTVLDPNTSLAARSNYYFWFEVGSEAYGSIENTPVPLPEMPEETHLQVTLYAIDEGLKTIPGADVGEIRVLHDGSAAVVRQPWADLPATAARGDRRLYFPVDSAGEEDVYRLRCNIYCRHVLVQSRLVRAYVFTSPTPSVHALESELDYAVNRTLDPRHLQTLRPQQLSLLLSNGTGNTMSFSFFGSSGDEMVKHESRFDVLELQDAIQQARGVLRRIAWGDEADWDASKPYRYGGQTNWTQLRNDLVSLAIRGYRLYDMAIDRVSGDREHAEALAKVMRTPGVVQIATPQSPRFTLPAALFYDYRLDTAANFDTFRLCPAFLEAAQSAADLADSACFKGACPSRGMEDEAAIVCPSGFWGFRHRLGFPVSTNSSTLDVPVEIDYHDDSLRAVSGRSTDPAFQMWPAHELKLHQIRDGLVWQSADTRAKLLALLRESAPHVVYLYCHGGTVNNVPYIQIGPLDDKVITRDNLRNEKIHWRTPRPLIFINGCRTAALEPARALEFVTALMGIAAAGVVGTEITLFEPLAVAFAEHSLKQFLAEVQLGEAMRNTRLALLKSGNPLGLIYTSYALAGLRLVNPLRVNADSSR